MFDLDVDLNFWRGEEEEKNCESAIQIFTNE